MDDAAAASLERIQSGSARMPVGVEAQIAAARLAVVSSQSGR